VDKESHFTGLVETSGGRESHAFREIKKPKFGARSE
jgi:hypothetical protein